MIFKPGDIVKVIRDSHTPGCYGSASHDLPLGNCYAITEVSEDGSIKLEGVKYKGFAESRFVHATNIDLLYYYNRRKRNESYSNY